MSLDMSLALKLSQRESRSRVEMAKTLTGMLRLLLGNRGQVFG